MQIICWNMQRKRASWRFLHERHGDADAALLQEACTPPREIRSKLDVGPGPWIYKGWSGARAVVGMSGRAKMERVPVSDIIESAAPSSVIMSEARLAVAIAALPGGERIVLVSVESAGKATDRVPDMMLEIRCHCGTDLPYIVGADLTTWWDSDTDVFGDMMRIGLPLIGPHAPTFYSPINGQKPSDAHRQLDYVFASRVIAHRLSVRALNDPTDWGPVERCGEAEDFVGESERLKCEVSHHLSDRRMPDPDNQRLLNELGRHNDRGNLLRFQEDPRVEPTNNRAERALRGTVIARKVSHCLKTDDGAEAYSAFTSVMRTLARKVDDETLVDALCDVFGGAPLPAPSL